MAYAEKLGRDLFERLRKATADEPGVTRIAYGEGERIAYAMMAEAAAAWDAETRFDAAGNQFITLPGRDRRWVVEIGSHLDSVPHGGNFDGAAGVILGLALQAALAKAGRQPPFDLTVVCLRAEESCWFPHSYIGSKTALGMLDPDILDNARRADTGRSLAQHMREAGFDPEAVRVGSRLIDPKRVLAYIEPHIEQGPVLASEQLPLGIVTGIRGSFRYRDARCFGEYAHSGATPRHLRKDAVVATARLIVALQERWERLEREGADVTITFGQVGTDPVQHSFSKVAGETRFCLDVRSLSLKVLDEVRAAVDAIVKAVEASEGVSFELGPISGSAPAPMSSPLGDMLDAACRACGLPVRHMSSGAGHDAATYALAGIPTTMLFVRNRNGSHNPLEHLDMSDFDKALAVLVSVMDRPAEEWLGLRGPAEPSRESAG